MGTKSSSATQFAFTSEATTKALMGWYVANEGAVRSKGTMCFALHQHGQHMTGRWVGLSYDGPVVTGFGVIARTEDEIRTLMDELRGREPTLV
jgi:hypothetical protein